MNTAGPASHPNRTRWLYSAAASIAAVVIVVLSLEVRALRSQVRELERMRAFPFVGQWVPTARVPSLNGDSVTIGETTKGRSQVLIVFSASCPYCLETLPAWKRISAELLSDSAQRHDVYWLSVSSRDSTAQYVAEHGITAPVVFPPDKKLLHVYRVKGVPMTLVLDYRGRIVHVRPTVLASQSGIDSVLAAVRHADTVDTGVRPVSGAGSPQGVRRGTNIVPDQR